MASFSPDWWAWSLGFEFGLRLRFLRDFTFGLEVFFGHGGAPFLGERSLW